jgi:hypothetical protein
MGLPFQWQREMDFQLICGYHSMLHGMTKTKYGFFLDEMVKHQNWVTIERLQFKGANPFDM